MSFALISPTPSTASSSASVAANSSSKPPNSLTIRVTASQRLGEAGFPKGKPQSVGAQRLLKAVEQGDRVDERLWTGITKLVGGGHNSTALVGTPDQVADALLAYYDLGVRSILIRGFDPLNDAVEYGRELIPLTRAKVAERERRRATA